MKRSLYQVLEMVDMCPKEDQVRVLRDNQSPALLTVLRYALDERVVWHLPEGVPPFRPWMYGDAESQLAATAKKLYVLVSNGDKPSALEPNPADGLKERMKKRNKREKIFVEILESIDPRDADLLLAAKDKKLPFSNISADTIREAFPGIF